MKNSNIDKKVTRISKELRPILNSFLMSHKYREQFIHMAKFLGYEGDTDDIAKVTACLFTVKNDEIGFVVGELYDLFLDFQIDQVLETTPLFKAILTNDPSKKELLRTYSKMILNKEEIDTNQLNKDIYDTK